LQDLEKSPHIAVVLDITPDHLNHHLDFGEYIKAKSNLIAHQISNDFAVLHPNLPSWFQTLGQAQKIAIDPAKVETYERKLIGNHNLINIAAAASVAELLSIPTNVVLEAVADFEPLPHRLNVVRTVNGVTFVDDGYSTNIEPTIAAIDAIDSNIVLIIGGYDKKIDFTKLLHIRRKSKAWS
jgi:UDP-N-acetylmuramoylalanine--D-glutamate ligase